MRVRDVGPDIETVIDEAADAASLERPRPTEPFDAFFRREQRGLVALAYALTGNRALAEDIAQDALIAASRKWATISRYDNPQAWTRRVVANRSTSAVRRRINDAKALTRLAGRRFVPPTDGMPSDSEHVWAIIRRLPRRQAQAITLRALHRLSLQEIGEVLGVSKETAQTHLDRARAAVQAQLDEGDRS